MFIIIDAFTRAYQGRTVLSAMWFDGDDPVVNQRYSSRVLLLGSFVLFGVAPNSTVFGVWATPIVYLVVSGYLIAPAVN